jgi:hypothetical protein
VEAGVGTKGIDGKPALGAWLKGVASGPATHGWPGMLLGGVTALVTLVAAVLGFALFPADLELPRFVLAIPGLVAGGLFFLVAGVLVHATCVRPGQARERPLASAVFGYAVLAMAVLAIVAITVVAVRSSL